MRTNKRSGFFILPAFTKRNVAVLASLAAAFIGLFLIFGVVYANDSYAYLMGGIHVSPLYPSLIALLQLLFPERFPTLLVLLQELLTAYAIFSLVSFLSARFSFKTPFTFLIACGLLGAYLLRLALVGENALYCNTILTEAITYPLYYLFVKYAFAAYDQNDMKYLLTAVAFTLLLSLTRGQMLFLVLVDVLLFLLICRANAHGRVGLRKLCLRAGMAGVGFAAILLLSSALYHYATVGVARSTTMGKEVVLGALLYSSDASDAALFASDPASQALFSDTMTRCEKEGVTHQSAPNDPIKRFKHYEASHDMVRRQLHSVVNLLNGTTDSVDDTQTRLQISAFAPGWIRVLLRANLAQYLKTCTVNCFGGLVRTNSILSKIGVLWSAFVYALCLLCLLATRKSAAFCGEKKFLSLILICSLTNAVFCSFGVFELSRYVYYNFPCQYLALALYLFRLYEIRGASRRTQSASS